MANAQIHVDYLDNGRNGFYLIHAGYKFSVKNRYKDRCYWRCVNRECNATVTTDQNVPVRFGNEHNHPSDITGITAEAFIADLKKLCREDLTPLPSLYDDALGSLRNRDCDETVEHVIEKIPTFESCRSSLYCSRSKLLPKLPQNQNDIDLHGEWTKTLAGEEFLLCDETDERGDRILIFGTRSNLRHLCDSPTILGDGTFYCCTRLFCQLYSLHGDIGGTLFPLVFALLPNKTERTYLRLFSMLKDVVQQRIDRVFTPEIIILDFEVAARNAIHTVFPMATLRGCFFHYTQCIWRKTQACGLATRYREEDDVRRLVRRAAVLPLVPPGAIEDVWFEALESVEMTPDINRFTDYVTETWVEGDIFQCSHFDHDGPRTTNHVEGWHSRMNKKCQRPHPNVYAMVRFLQKEQASNEAKIIQLRAGAKQRPRKRKYIELDSRLVNLKNKLSDGRLGVLEYADAASYLLHI